MLMATISAVRTLLRNMSRMIATRAMPNPGFPYGVPRQMSQLRAVVVGLDFHARQHPAGRGIVDFLDLGLNVFQGWKGVFALSQQHDAPHLVGIVVSDC